MHNSGPDPQMVQKGKELCEDLLANVKEQYEEFKARPPRNFGGSGGYGDRSHNSGGYGERSHGSGGYQGYNRNNGYSNSPAPVAEVATASPPAASGNTPGAADYAAQYAQYYGTSDPYAAYGGYAA